MTLSQVEITVLTSILTAVVAVGGFSISRRKERDANVKHQAFIDISLQNIQETLNEITNDIKEIKDTTSVHEGRLNKLELLTGELQRQLQQLAAAFRAEKGIK